MSLFRHINSRRKHFRRSRSAGEFLADLVETAESPAFKRQVREELQAHLLARGIPLREFIDPLLHDIDLLDESSRTHSYVSNRPWPMELLESPT